MAEYPDNCELRSSNPSKIASPLVANPEYYCPNSQSLMTYLRDPAFYLYIIC
ncbi:unnamed protein product, partial [Allacma fusca]